MPGYFLNTQAEAHAICEEVGEPNLKVQMDFYHAQIVEGDVAMTLRKYFAGVGHVQIASVPERHEPDDGEVNYRYLFACWTSWATKAGWAASTAQRADRGWIGLAEGAGIARQTADRLNA